MLHVEQPNQAFYAPLSQVMTDSESEEEIHNISKHRLYQQQQFPLKQINSELNKSNGRYTDVLFRESASIADTAQQESLQQNQDHLQRQHSVINPTHQVQAPIDNVNQPPSSYTTNMQNTFRSVMMSDLGFNGVDGSNCDPATNFSNFNCDYEENNSLEIADDIAILDGNENAKNSPLTIGRRCCFIASLMLCIFAVVGFVWMVPCDENSECPARVDRIKTHNWLNNYTKIELKGSVNVVNGVREWEKNLIFLYRGDAIFPGGGNSKRNGIISLIGNSGAVAWYDEMQDEPVAIECTLIDVDRNGRPDCLVLDEFGELGAINSMSGQWMWRFKERSAIRVDAMDFPVILPDLDGDNVLEILLVTSVDLAERTRNYVQRGEIGRNNHREGGLLEQRNLLRILSGRTGRPIGEGLKIHDCDVLRKLQLESSRIVTFTCIRNNTEAQRSKTLGELFSLITNKSALKQKLVTASKIAQYRHYGHQKDSDGQRSIYSLSGRELVVENRGVCPDDCNVTLVLSETRNGQMKVLRNFTNSGMYGMVPVQWHFKGTQSKMSGFVMKFWKWNSMKNDPHEQFSLATAGSPTTAGVMASSHNANVNGTPSKKKTKYHGSDKDNISKAKSGNNKPGHVQSNKTKKLHQKLSFDAKSSNPDDYDIFDHLIQKRHTYSIPKEMHPSHRMVNASIEKEHTNVINGHSVLMNNYKMQMITETVILVLFIGGDTRIENTSQSNIIQFCRRNYNDVVCQPSLNNQENSMLIADLDDDGSQELVSYMSTYVQADGPNGQDWNLITYVRLLRLQSELPAFYENEKAQN